MSSRSTSSGPASWPSTWSISGITSTARRSRRISPPWSPTAPWTGGSYGFVGFANYAFLAGDPDWWRAVRNTLIFAAVSVALETALGLAIALVLDAEIRGRGLLRAAVLVPWAIPTVVSAQLWA